MAKAIEKNVIESVIGIDTERELIHFYSAQNGDYNSINYLMSGYRAKPFTPEFYEKVGAALAQHRQDHPDQPINKVSVVLPDSLVLTDTINLPPINKKALDSSLAASLNNIYKNSAELKFNRVLALQTKNMTTYAVTAMKKEILINLQKAFAQNQIEVVDYTYAASAASNAVFTLNPEIRNNSFVILDIKEEYAKVIFVCKGKTLGFYALPFGHKIMYKTRVTPEDLIFDHSTADLIVLNAREKAKAKNITLEEEQAQVTTTAEAEAEDDEEELELLPLSKRKPKEEEEEDDFEDVAEEEEQESEFITRKNKKPARKLPKFMIRPTPTNREGYMYENFRLFIKWTLEAIAANPAVTALGAPEAVYVNMPEEYNFLYDMTNLELEENGLPFLPLFSEAPAEVIKKNLELYGGFYTKQFNGFNNFMASANEVVRPQAEEKADAKDKESGDAKADEAVPEQSFIQKALEVIKKIATYDLTGGKK